MNHLANLYLARHKGDRMLGCLIGEIIRTTNQDKYNEHIMEGIELNKNITNFCLQHPAYLRSKNRLHPKYSKHSGKIIDIFYDHFLASNWNHYSELELAEYCTQTYAFINENYQTLPYKLRKLTNVMIQDNWLFHYSSVEGIHRYMREITRRDTFQTNLEYSLEDLIQSYHAFKADFDELFPALISFADEQMRKRELVLQIA
ncbi:MAG: acyl carrier protein phosphodiesterase [Cytophagaceae bacterium]|jgi:acyl carrier protein phosphodiesterase|nr:acyl carrier protein phosphodiesterase [Cytophagaceae bacterium]